LPGLRSAIFLTAGIMGVRPAIFFTLDGIAALLSVPFWVVVGWWFGKNLDEALSHAKRLQIYILLGVAVFITSYVFIKLRRRRLERASLSASRPAYNQTQGPSSHS